MPESGKNVLYASSTTLASARFLTSVDVLFDDIVKVNVYLADIADLAAMNEAYAAF